MTAFRMRDVAEIAVGGCVLAFPVTVTEEVWNLGAELSLPHALWFSLGSLLFLALTIYFLHDHAEFKTHNAFVRRVIVTYGLTLMISAMLLLGVDRLELLDDPATGLKRMILVAFPASFAATVVDSFGSRTQGTG